MTPAKSNGSLHDERPDHNSADDMNPGPLAESAADADQGETASTVVNTTSVSTDAPATVSDVHHLEKAVDDEKSSEHGTAADEGFLPPQEEGVHEEEHPAEVSPMRVDYLKLTREELISTLQQLLEKVPVTEIGDDADVIKINFYKKHKAEVERQRKKFVENGGNIEDFKAEDDPLEEQFKELFKVYRDRKADFNKQVESEKQENLKLKYQIIEEIKVLLGKGESVNETFQEFRELQKRWRGIGPVPQTQLKDLWDTYNHHVEKFYDFVKINNELRDLDLKKNLETKVRLCEKAEELLLENDAVKAFRELQKLHDDWRDTGPVPREIREEIWNRFKDVTSKINKRHQDFFETQKEKQVSNLEQKTLLCEKVEELCASRFESVKEWDEKSNEILEIQKIWKSVGYAPKKDNNKIYQRFRAACDDFFSRKREFFSHFKEDQQNNLQLKTELCLQAEALKTSTEWKKTTEDLIQIQKRWKEIGPVPRKHADQIWKRFRAACDEFFTHKSSHFSNIDSKYEENLRLKKELILEIENYQPLEDVDQNFVNLKDFQRRWTEIGFVPMRDKDEIQQRYREAINKHFDNLRMDDDRKKLLKFRNRLDGLQQKHKGNVKIRVEREKLISKLKQLESDIVLWENNIGFFAKSKNAEIMINDVQRKIDEAKEKIVTLEEQIRLIDLHTSES
ncbi:MAG: DUF349 domain-containing protein [Bacteroidales bacterium]